VPLTAYNIACEGGLRRPVGGEDEAYPREACVGQLGGGASYVSSAHAHSGELRINFLSFPCAHWHSLFHLPLPRESERVNTCACVQEVACTNYCMITTPHHHPTTPPREEPQEESYRLWCTAPTPAHRLLSPVPSLPHRPPNLFSPPLSLVPVQGAMVEDAGTANVVIPVAVHQGFLTKCGRVRKSWKRRMFHLLSDGTLKYYAIAGAAKEVGRAT